MCRRQSGCHGERWRVGVCISNSYGSITCIRFEGMISARMVGHPFDFSAQR